MVSLDGKVHLVDANSGKILSSFSSGRPIHSSYQSFMDRDDGDSKFSNFVECGDDWALYLHGKHGVIGVCLQHFCVYSCIPCYF